MELLCVDLELESLPALNGRPIARFYRVASYLVAIVKLALFTFLTRYGYAVGRLYGTTSSVCPIDVKMFLFFYKSLKTCFLCFLNFQNAFCVF